MIIFLSMALCKLNLISLFPCHFPIFWFLRFRLLFEVRQRIKTGHFSCGRSPPGNSQLNPSLYAQPLSILNRHYPQLDTGSNWNTPVHPVSAPTFLTYELRLIMSLNFAEKICRNLFHAFSFFFDPDVPFQQISRLYQANTLDLYSSNKWFFITSTLSFLCLAKIKTPPPPAWTPPGTPVGHLPWVHNSEVSPPLINHALFPPSPPLSDSQFLQSS